jgi:arginine repressor
MVFAGAAATLAVFIDAMSADVLAVVAGDSAGFGGVFAASATGLAGAAAT